MKLKMADDESENNMIVLYVDARNSYEYSFALSTFAYKKEMSENGLANRTQVGKVK